MSTQSPLGGRTPFGFPTIPQGEVVGTYATYEAAQQAVDDLATKDFPVQSVSIVGSDLKSVERVTGKLTYGRAAAAGAISGLWFGLIFGFLILIFSPQTPPTYLFATALIGAGVGLLFSLISYALNRRRRDFSSVMQVVASSYQVIVTGEGGNRARNLIDTQTAAAPDAAPEAHPSDPPRADTPPAGPTSTA